MKKNNFTKKIFKKKLLKSLDKEKILCYNNIIKQGRKKMKAENFSEKKKAWKSFLSDCENVYADVFCYQDFTNLVLYLVSKNVCKFPPHVFSEGKAEMIFKSFPEFEKFFMSDKKVKKFIKSCRRLKKAFGDVNAEKIIFAIDEIRNKYTS